MLTDCSQLVRTPHEHEHPYDNKNLKATYLTASLLLAESRLHQWVLRHRPKFRWFIGSVFLGLDRWRR